MPVGVCTTNLEIESPPATATETLPNAICRRSSGAEVSLELFLSTLTAEFSFMLTMFFPPSVASSTLAAAAIVLAPIAAKQMQWYEEVTGKPISLAVTKGYDFEAFGAQVRFDFDAKLKNILNAKQLKDIKLGDVLHGNNVYSTGASVSVHWTW